MRRFPPIKALLAFAAAARHLHFGRAGAELNVSGSAISHQIAKLEAEIGSRLFVRANGRVSTTPVGRALAAGLEKRFDEIEALLARASTATAGRRKVTVVAGASLASLWLADRIERYRRANRGMHIKLTSVSDWPSSGTHFDVAILYAGASAPRYPWAPFAKEAVAPYASPGVSRRLGKRPSLKAIASLPLIGSSNILNWSDWFRAFDAEHLFEAEDIELDRSMLAIDLARRGKGLVLESDLLAHDLVRDGRLIRLAPQGAAPIWQHAYRIALGPSAASDASVAEFVHWLWHALPARNCEPIEAIEALFAVAKLS
ncbi:MAG: LysR family transcriptional regulator [Rhodospirillales bacterium]|nr:LysR family transcriptional regulator [Rhodospirillales bacterium]